MNDFKLGQKVSCSPISATGHIVGIGHIAQLELFLVLSSDGNKFCETFENIEVNVDSITNISKIPDAVKTQKRFFWANETTLLPIGK